MKKNILLLIIALISVACSKDSEDNNEKECSLVSAKITGFYYDDITISNDASNSNFSGKISFEYDIQNRINKVKGGLQHVPDGNNLNKWGLSNDVEDVVTYDNNTIKVDYSANSESKPYKKEFTLNNGILISRKVTKIYPLQLDPVIYTYEYNGDEIKEKINGKVYRTFTLSADNLIKIEQIKYGFPNNEIVGKREYLFLNYDSSQNLLKGKFYINGAFFKAFSKNNYTQLKIREYSFKDNTYTLEDESGTSFELTYDADNIASLFERDCK
ncbi:hypothetical protein D0809_16380 [Flavobacterium circumlabens]|uniref:DUF4595 domain-containing protein n=1 Tax=Flavobacterium circumlabens TaxID=2133765 RepID=A0A4Y7U9A7_9FLAO|nr:hypothetical protein [Flavobacterium circumlabens]TCN55583.1 hypothetical protein EV142_106273 [Flavobacterium circumlabens]TEB43015.1 hypothetical protein D0809_16380 [Flavobacterium circumlabens]